MSSQTQVETKNTLPLWLAVAITVVVSLPFGLWLGRWNLALFCSFIVWAEYFALGAKPEALKLILPSFAIGAILTAASMILFQLLVTFLPSLLAPGDLAMAVALFVGVGFMVYAMRWWKTLEQGSLPFFNGISMLLALYFTKSFIPTGNVYLDPLSAALFTVLSGWFGALLGWFNILILFPHKVHPRTTPQGPGVGVPR